MGNPEPESGKAEGKAKMKGYRSKESYRAKDPAKRARQLSGLKQYKGTKPTPTIKQILDRTDIIQFAEEYLGISFRERPAQEVILRSLYGLPLSDEQLEIYCQLTGLEHEHEPGVEKTEAVLNIGARGGKSLLASIIGLYETTKFKWRKYLNDGEIGYGCIVATRQRQAELIIQANCAELLRRSKLRGMLHKDSQTELTFKHGMRIMSLPCNSTAGRGIPIVILILDEVAHYRIEGPLADERIFNALRPRMAQFPGAKVILISTAAAKQGLFWNFFSEGFQVPGRLTVQAPTRLVNPLIPQEFIDKEYRRDPDNAEREFGAQFAEQVDAYFPADKLGVCFVLAGDVPPVSGVRYYAGCDQSGLAGRDRFGFVISHFDGEKVIVDLVRSWSTTDSDTILNEIASICKAYNIPGLLIDSYASGWVRQAFEKAGLQVGTREPLPVIYANLKSLVIAGRIAMPDNPELKSGLTRTQAFYSRSNTLSIGHERDRFGHGDLADACATAVFGCSHFALPAELLAVFGLDGEIGGQINI